MGERWDNAERKQVCAVCPGDLVTVRLVLDTGSPTPNGDGLRPHLLYKPRFQGLDAKQPLNGNDKDPIEYRVNGPTIWCPWGGELFTDGNVAGVIYEVSFTRRPCAQRPPLLRHALTYFRTSAMLARPRGAVSLFVPQDGTYTFSWNGAGGTAALVSVGDDYPLGLFSHVTPPAGATAVHFHVEL